MMDETGRLMNASVRGGAGSVDPRTGAESPAGRGGSIDPRRALREVFGHDDFRPGQAPLVEALLAGRDVIGILPTGAGKSLCYQLPALLMPGLTLVLSPLIALMTDQVRGLREKGIAAAAVHASMSGWEREELLDKALRGELCLLYLSPERFTSAAFEPILKSLDVACICVDEAHCLSAWGDEFRPAYRQIGEVVRRVWGEGQPLRPPVCALTASAAPAVRADICASLGLIDPVSEVLSFDRPNLYFRVEKPSDKLAFLLHELASRRGRCGIIYCQTRQSVDALTRFLLRNGHSALPYHAGLNRRDRQRHQADWMSGRVPVMVATNAFGMGIDKPDVRFVIHFQMPGSMEAYYQEAGRAGRDGQPAECLLLYSFGDVRIQIGLMREGLLDRRKRLERGRASLGARHPAPDLPASLRARQLTCFSRAPRLDTDPFRDLHTMMGYVSERMCLRKFILNCFGEEAADERCGRCSVCAAKSAEGRRQDSKNTSDEELFIMLKELRSNILGQYKCRRFKKPLIRLFSDQTLRDMAALKPVTWLALITVPDVSIAQVLMWGRPFINEIRSWIKTRPLTPTT